MRSLSAVALPAVALCLALIPFGAHAWGRPAEINNPTIELNTKASPAQVKKAVKLAVLTKQWNISKETPGAFDATYTRPESKRGPVTAKIHVTYSTRQVKIKYVSSEGLKADGNMISPDYNRWMSALERDIPIYVEREVTASQ